LLLILSLSACSTDAPEHPLEGTGGLETEAVFLTVDGREVTAGMYLYWLGSICREVADACAAAGETVDWEMPVEDGTLGSYVKEQALASVALYATVENRAEQYGCAVTEETETAIDAEWAEKVAEYGAEIAGQVVSDDDTGHIAAGIRGLLEMGADLIVCTGGMSVDPDDRTPGAIRQAGARIVSYGAPVLPGAMFLLAYYGEDNIPVIGVPGCAMYNKRTVLDLALPHLFAGDILDKGDLDRLGEGGLCLNCEVCHFPNCGFGR
jgi:hypothetical protein